MFTKNDKGEERRFYNGKIGRISSISETEIKVTFPEEENVLTLSKETWKNIRYSLNASTNAIEEEELGTFTQYPLRLAWAVTIHKSQGLTFSKAIVDAGDSFAPGQVYVALSRLTSMKNLVLHSAITAASISTDENVVAYSEEVLDEAEMLDHLEQGKLNYMGNKLIEAFNCDELVDAMIAFQKTYDERQLPNKPKIEEWFDALLEQVAILGKTGKSFMNQLHFAMPQARDDGFKFVSERVAAGSTYFINALDGKILFVLRKHINEMETLKKVKQYVKSLEDLSRIISSKKKVIQAVTPLLEDFLAGGDRL
jgi:hypothetical protein